MRNLIVVAASVMSFIALAAGVFRDLSFATTLMRAAVVGGVALLVGFVVVSIWVWFSLVGVRRESSRPGGEGTPGKQGRRNE